MATSSPDVDNATIGFKANGTVSQSADLLK